jgi:hypothetical protein
MPANHATRRARLYSRATGLSLAPSYQRVKADSPLLPLPSEDQLKLEGDFFNAIRYLRYIPRAEANWQSLGQRIRILDMEPRADCLALRLSPETDVASILGSTLPQFDRDGVLAGIPELRMTITSGESVTVTRVGTNASMSFSGAETRALQLALETHEHRYIQPKSPTRLHRSESQELVDRDDYFAHNRASTSALVRRVGFLDHFDPRAFDMWWWPGNGTAVEVFARTMTPEAVAAFAADMTDNRLHPQLRLVESSGFHSAYMCMTFATLSHEKFIQVRMRGDG